MPYQIDLKTSLVNSVEKALANTEGFIKQWREQLEKIQKQLNGAVDSFKNPGWIEWFFSLFEFAATQKASQAAVEKLELLSKTDADPNRLCNLYDSSTNNRKYFKCRYYFLSTQVAFRKVAC